ncbi:MAG: hypothetical protein QW063_00855 [Candidatus Nanoarchaeia archaeon]
MAWDDEHILMLVGFLIVLIVGLNIILVFNSISKISLTGAAIASSSGELCKSTSDGIMCGEKLYPNTPVTGLCPSGYVPICTNACKLESALTNKELSCGSGCTTICIPTSLAKRLSD